MGFYDHFQSSETRSVTRIGRLLVKLKNQHFIEISKGLCTRSNISVLEIGSGHGFFAQQCRQNGVDYVALEANQTMADALVEQGFEVHRGFAPPISIERQFDVILMDQVFEHMRGRDEAIEMIRSCKEHLTPGGLIVICSPDIFMVKQDFFADYTHNNPTCMPMLDGILTDCELDIVYRNYIALVVRGLLATRVLAFTARTCYALGLFHLAFGKRAYQAKVSLLPSCLIIGRLTAPSSH